MSFCIEMAGDLSTRLRNKKTAMKVIHFLIDVILMVHLPFCSTESANFI